MNKPLIQLRAVVREDEPAPPPATAQDFVRRAMTADREQLEALFAEALGHAAAQGIAGVVATHTIFHAAQEPPWVEPWNRAANEIGNESTFDSREHIIKFACLRYAEQHAAALAQERDALCYDLEQAKAVIDQWQESWHKDTTRLTAERDRLAAERHLLRVVLQEARTLVEEWLPTHTPMPPSKEELVLAQIDAALSGKEQS